MTPVLTILLPTHNRADTLEWALRSLEVQTRADFEVLICGDGCTDGTANLALEWVKKDARFRWFDLPKGPGFGYANRNIVLQEARGEFIGFMAHDDLVFRDHFERMMEPFDDPAVHLVASRSFFVDDAATIVPAANNLECSLAQDVLMEGYHYLPATAYMHRRTAFAEVGWWDETLLGSGDLDFWRRILLFHGFQSVRYLTTPGVFHFRAIWKTAEHADPHQLEGWHQLLETPGAFPDILRSPKLGNQLPQAHLGELLLGTDGLLWEQKIRHASDLALDSYAFQQARIIYSLNDKVRYREQEKERLKKKIQELKDRFSQSRLEQKGENQERIDILKNKLATAKEQITFYKNKSDEQRQRAEKWKQKANALATQKTAAQSGWASFFKKK